MTHFFLITEHLEALSLLRGSRSFTKEGVSSPGRVRRGRKEPPMVTSSETDVLPYSPCYNALPMQKELPRSSLVRNPRAGAGFHPYGIARICCKGFCEKVLLPGWGEAGRWSLCPARVRLCSSARRDPLRPPAPVMGFL